MKDKRIAVCDDQEDVCSLLTIVFRKQGCEVFVFHELDGLDPLIDIRPDLILMDLKIPGLGGIRAVELLRENASLQHVPVILISGNPALHEIGEELETPSLGKPFQINQLMEMAGKILA